MDAADQEVSEIFTAQILLGMENHSKIPVHILFALIPIVLHIPIL